MIRLAVPMSLMVALGLPLLAPAAVAEPMKGRYELRCQDPQTRQWTVAGQVTDPEIAERSGVDAKGTGGKGTDGKDSGGKAGGREVRGTGTDGRPVVLPMPSDRTCMLSAR